MSESGFKNISAAAFAKLDFETVTLIDLREPDELLISGIPGAVNIPFSSFPKGIDAIPMGKPVYVFCREGSFSEEVAEILFERGYEVYNLEGGFNEYRNLLNDNSVLKRGFVGDSDAANPTILSWDEEIFVDAKALRCPGPIVKVADTLRGLPEGSVVRVEATEDAFTSDIKVWTERTGNLLLSLSAENGIISARIQKKTAAGSVDDSHFSGNVNVTADSLNGRHIQLGDDKTFIVFSGDLDKTIAAFIMANGAASLGRKVTMFFTFWGLNILRRSEKVKVDKSFIEKMFGWMMPRGSL